MRDRVKKEEKEWELGKELERKIEKNERYIREKETLIERGRCKLIEKERER